VKRNFDSANEAEIARILASSDSWHVEVDDRAALALFRLETYGSKATISELCVKDNDAITAVAPTLRKDLHGMGLSEIALRVLPSTEQAFGAAGFRRRDVYLRFSRERAEIKMMPILPLMNVAQKELPILSQLMFDAYAKTGNGVSDVEAAEKSLRNIISGVAGMYLSNASFASGALPNLVSACLFTEYSPGQARITQMFTHPLYRARGLATIEIASGMSRLLGTGIRRVIAWNREGNRVVTRLLTKLEFKEDERATEMTASV
jgi:hypothetical protein